MLDFTSTPAIPVLQFITFVCQNSSRKLDFVCEKGKMKSILQLAILVSIIYVLEAGPLPHFNSENKGAILSLILFLYSH